MMIRYYGSSDKIIMFVLVFWSKNSKTDGLTNPAVVGGYN